jgi:glyoxylase-like metal-dependent hydrolase (beta-lactamase superfamily II)
VPAERVRVLEGGETIGEFRVAYTPGHASHHVCYLHAPSGTVFTGDVAGVRIDGACALPPTPPPDIDVEAWLESLRTLEAWRPSRLALTHFGAYADVAQHLAELRAEFERLGEAARELDEEGFVAAVRSRVREAARGETAAAYEQAMPPWQSYQGLVRAAAQAQARGVCEHPPRGGSTA